MVWNMTPVKNKSNLSHFHRLLVKCVLIAGMKEDNRPVLVKDLLKLLYEKACQQNLWGLVRHTAGMLGKRVEDLAKALTDLLVRQKQVNSRRKLCYQNNNSYSCMLYYFLKTLIFVGNYWYATVSRANYIDPFT